MSGFTADYSLLYTAAALLIPLIHAKKLDRFIPEVPLPSQRHRATFK